MRAATIRRRGDRTNFSGARKTETDRDKLDRDKLDRDKLDRDKLRPKTETKDRDKLGTGRLGWPGPEYA